VLRRCDATAGGERRGIHKVRDPRGLAAVFVNCGLTRDSVARAANIAPRRILPDAPSSTQPPQNPINGRRPHRAPVFGGRHQRRSAAMCSSLGSGAGEPKSARRRRAANARAAGAVEQAETRSAVDWKQPGGAVEVSERVGIPAENLTLADLVRRLCLVLGARRRSR